MNWEPMTEDAVFERGERVHVWYASVGFEVVTYDPCDGEDFVEDGGIYHVHRRYITHFARITNPNESKDKP